jgi:hypothetical protein
MPKLKTLKEVPKAVAVSTDVPPLKFELPHAKLSRLTSEQERLVEEIRSHKTTWANRNMVAQNKRQTISTAELTAFKQHHGELSKALSETSLKIGELNRELRANKAAKQNGNHRAPIPLVVDPVNRRTAKKGCALKDRSDWAEYFVLAARGELTDALYAQIERAAKGMIEQALMTGISE